MKQVHGIWLPDHDEHFAGVKKGVPVAQNYQRLQLDKALALVKHFRFAIDGGAHVGLMARVLGERFEHVYAFEPADDVYECLLKNTEHVRSRVLPIKAALGRTTGKIGMTLDYKDNTGDRQVDPKGDNVQMVHIDRDGGPAHLDFLKLDIQGYEYEALRGGAETLKRCKPVCMIEVEDPRKMTRSFGDPKKAIQYLEKLGAKIRERVGHDWILSWEDQ